eukprot:s604_g17.t1
MGGCLVTSLWAQAYQRCRHTSGTPSIGSHESACFPETIAAVDDPSPDVPGPVDGITWEATEGSPPTLCAAESFERGHKELATVAQRAFQPESLTELNIIKFFLCADSSLPTLKSSCLGLFSQRYTDALCSKPVSKWTHSYVRIPKAPVFFGVAAVSSRGQCAFGQNPQLMSSCALWLLAWTLPIYLRTGSGKEPRREVPPLDAWRALASTLILASYLTSRNGEDELFATWARRGRGLSPPAADTSRVASVCRLGSGPFQGSQLRRSLSDPSLISRTPRQGPIAGAAEPELRFSQRANLSEVPKATRRAPLAGLAFADCIGPDPGNFQRRPLYPNQKCLVVLARCGGLACEHIPGGRQAVLTHLRRLFRRTRRYHDIQGVELALLDHFQLDLSDMESEAKELAEVLLDGSLGSGLGKMHRTLRSTLAELAPGLGQSMAPSSGCWLKRKSPEWWQLPGERLGGDFDAWASPDKLSREQVISCLTSCRVKGTTFPQVLSSLRHWKVTTADLPERERTALKCALAWLRQPRVAFDSAVMLFSSLNLQASPKALSAFESEALLALGILVRTDRRALEAALQALSSDPVLSAPPAAWAWAAKALQQGAAWGLFTAERMPALCQKAKEEDATKKLNVTVIMKTVVAEWAALPDGQKAPKGREDTERYTKEIVAFKASDAYAGFVEKARKLYEDSQAGAEPGAPPKPIAQIIKEAEEKAKKASKLEKKREAIQNQLIGTLSGKADGPPKAPQTAFTLFSVANREQAMKELSGAGSDKGADKADDDEEKEDEVEEEPEDEEEDEEDEDEKPKKTPAI